MAKRTEAELRELRAGYRKHFYDPQVKEHGKDSVAPFKDAFAEFLRTLDANPNARPAWLTDGEG